MSPPHFRDGADSHTLPYGLAALRLHGLRHQQHRTYPASAHHPGFCVRDLLHPVRWDPSFMSRCHLFETVTEFSAFCITFAGERCIFMEYKSKPGPESHQHQQRCSQPELLHQCSLPSPTAGGCDAHICCPLRSRSCSRMFTRTCWRRMKKESVRETSNGFP